MQGGALPARPRSEPCDDDRLETSVIINILDDLDDGFSGQPVPDGVLPRPAFAIFSGRAGTSERVAPIGFDLSE
jgi:hypothetical protein